jgi:hypothetical protein
MGTSHEHAVRDAVQGLFHYLATGFDRNRVQGPRSVVAVLMTMIREQCGYERGIELVQSQNSDRF